MASALSLPGPSDAPPPPESSTLSILAASLPTQKYSTQARLYLSKYHALHTLSQRFLETASAACTKNLHHGCLCFIRTDLATCHALIRQLDTLSCETLEHSQTIGQQALAASERFEKLQWRRDKLAQTCHDVAWELIARECQADAQRNRWNGIIIHARRTRELPLTSRVGLMMSRARLELAEQAAKKVERRAIRLKKKFEVLLEKVNNTRRLAGFLGEYDDTLQTLQSHVDSVARGIEEKIKGMVKGGDVIWERKWSEHRAFQAAAGDTLDCPECLYERWSGGMEFGNRVGWFEADLSLGQEGEAIKCRERASSCEF